VIHGTRYTEQSTLYSDISLFSISDISHIYRKFSFVFLIFLTTTTQLGFSLYPLYPALQLDTPSSISFINQNGIFTYRNISYTYIRTNKPLLLFLLFCTQLSRLLSASFLFFLCRCLHNMPSLALAGKCRCCTVSWEVFCAVLSCIYPTPNFSLVRY